MHTPPLHFDWPSGQADATRLVRFFDQKSLYSVHGACALFIARQYYKTTAVIKYYGDPPTGLPGACGGERGGTWCVVARTWGATPVREMLDGRPVGQIWGGWNFEH